jgi:hypothetical protein
VLRVTRVIRFNAFDMSCVAHQSPGLWRHPHDQSWRYKDLTYWTELAKLLEPGRFDGLFIADVLGTYDIYGASDEAATRFCCPPQAGGAPSRRMALVTDNLGFGITTAKDAPRQRDHHTQRSADRRRGDALRGLAAVGQQGVRRGLRRQLAGVQGRPYIILAVFVVGIAYAVWMRYAKPEAYAEIGRTVIEDSHEPAET